MKDLLLGLGFGKELMFNINKKTTFWQVVIKQKDASIVLTNKTPFR